MCLMEIRIVQEHLIYLNRTLVMFKVKNKNRGCNMILKIILHS